MCFYDSSIIKEHKSNSILSTKPEKELPSCVMTPPTTPYRTNYENDIYLIRKSINNNQLAYPLYKFPDSELWRLFIDGNRQNDNPLEFDKNEPGYLSALMKSFEFMIDTLGEKLTPELYVKFQKLAIKDVYTNSTKSTKMIPGLNHVRSTNIPYKQCCLEEAKLAQNKKDKLLWTNKAKNTDESIVSSKLGLPITTSYNIHLDRNASENGINEFKNKKSSSTLSDRMLAIHCFFQNNGQCLSHYRRTHEYYINFINQIIKEYYNKIEYINAIINGEESEKDKEIKKEKYENEILNIIASTCQNLDQLHAFSDGNIRTIAFIVLNKMLLENKLSPTIMDNPNIFDMCSIKEIINGIKKGQQTFNSYIT